MLFVQVFSCTNRRNPNLLEESFLRKLRFLLTISEFRQQKMSFGHLN